MKSRGFLACPVQLRQVTSLVKICLSGGMHLVTKPAFTCGGSLADPPLLLIGPIQHAQCGLRCAGLEAGPGDRLGRHVRRPRRAQPGGDDPGAICSRGGASPRGGEGARRGAPRRHVRARGAPRRAEAGRHQAVPRRPGGTGPAESLGEVLEARLRGLAGDRPPRPLDAWRRRVFLLRHGWFVRACCERSLPELQLRNVIEFHCLPKIVVTVGFVLRKRFGGSVFKEQIFH